MFTSILTGEITLTIWLICLAVSFACGAILAFAAGFRAGATKSFLTSMILLPAVVTTVIMMVNGNVGTGIAVAGTFSLVRFRSAKGTAREIVLIFIAMAAGLTSAAGYVGIALLLTVILAAIIVALSFVSFGTKALMDLRVTVPENLNFHDGFEDLFKQYTKSHKLIRVKTTNMGSLYKLLYRIEMKNENEEKAFMDALRTRNGNLEISIGAAEDESEL